MAEIETVVTGSRTTVRIVKMKALACNTVVNQTFRAGGKDDPRGLAHVVEHMIFKGTRTPPKTKIKGKRLRHAITAFPPKLLPSGTSQLTPPPSVDENTDYDLKQAAAILHSANIPREYLYLAYVVAGIGLNVGKGEIDNFTFAAGATTNAETDDAMTTYHFTVPGGNTRTHYYFLALLADSKQHPRFEEAEFEPERVAIINEYLKNLRIDYRLGVAYLNNKLLEEGEPGKHPTIGTLRSLLGLTVDDLKNFYAQHYKHNESMVTIVGSHDRPDDEKEVLEYLFGAHQSSSSPPDTPSPKPAAVSNDEPARSTPVVYSLLLKKWTHMVGFRLDMSTDEGYDGWGPTRRAQAVEAVQTYLSAPACSFLPYYYTTFYAMHEGTVLFYVLNKRAGLSRDNVQTRTRKDLATWLSKGISLVKASDSDAVRQTKYILQGEWRTAQANESTFSREFIARWVQDESIQFKDDTFASDKMVAEDMEVVMKHLLNNLNATKDEAEVKKLCVSVAIGPPPKGSNEEQNLQAQHTKDKADFQAHQKLTQAAERTTGSEGERLPRNVLTGAALVPKFEAVDIAFGLLPALVGDATGTVFSFRSDARANPTFYATVPVRLPDISSLASFEDAVAVRANQYSNKLKHPLAAMRLFPRLSIQGTKLVFPPGTADDVVAEAVHKLARVRRRAISQYDLLHVTEQYVSDTLRGKLNDPAYLARQGLMQAVRGVDAVPDIARVVRHLTQGGWQRRYAGGNPLRRPAYTFLIRGRS